MEKKKQTRKKGGGRKPLNSKYKTIRITFRCPENIRDFIDDRAEEREEEFSECIREMLLREMKRIRGEKSA